VISSVTLHSMVRYMLADASVQIPSAYRLALESLLARPSTTEQDAARWQEFKTSHCASPEAVQMLIDDAIAARKESAALVLG